MGVLKSSRQVSKNKTVLWPFIFNEHVLPTIPLPNHIPVKMLQSYRMPSRGQNRCYSQKWYSLLSPVQFLAPRLRLFLSLCPVLCQQAALRTMKNREGDLITYTLPVCWVPADCPEEQSDQDRPQSSTLTNPLWVKFRVQLKPFVLQNNISWWSFRAILGKQRISKQLATKLGQEING